MPSEVPSRNSPVAHAAVVWACFFALYLLFAGKASAAELAAGAVVATLAAAYQAVLRAKSGAPRVSLTALRPLLAATGTVLRDTPLVAAALARALAGSPGAGRVRIGTPSAGADSTSSAGRAIAITADSLAPNSFVVAAVFDRGEIVVHRLVDDASDVAA